MPELPDLQAFRHNLEKALLHKKLETIQVLNKKKLQVTEAALKAALDKPGAGKDRVRTIRMNKYFIKVWAQDYTD